MLTLHELLKAREMDRALDLAYLTLQKRVTSSPSPKEECLTLRIRRYCNSQGDPMIQTQVEFQRNSASYDSDAPF